MYLTKKTYVWSQNRDSLQIIGITGIKPERVQYIEEAIGYWRKANAIHKWFVDNVQDGDDDCGTYYVQEEHLQKLLDQVNEVLQDHSLASTVLPTQCGFFFGDTEYSEYYFQDLEATKKILENALQEAGQGSIHYHSSW